MADIYTHLRELGVAFFFFNEQPLNNITPIYFYSICIKNIDIPCDLTISMIAEDKNVFNEKELTVIKNALNLGNTIKNKFKINSKPKISWVGCYTQSDSPVDLVIDNYKFSLIYCPQVFDFIL